MAANPSTSGVRREISMWAMWALVVTTVTAFAVWAMHVLVDAPHRIGSWWVVGATAFVLPVVATVVGPLRKQAGPMLRLTVTAAGLVTMVLAVYLVVVVGLGDDVDGSEHRVLGRSMIAALVAVGLAGPVTTRVRDVFRFSADRRVSTAALQNFGARMTRAVAMDELLLQLVETLRETIAPLGAQVWTGEDGVLNLTASIPDRGAVRIELADTELAAISGTRVSGTSWAAMWLPDLLGSFGEPGTFHLRIAPITHLGNVLGLIVGARRNEDGAFDPGDDDLLADLARQVGLALHNVQLDSALQVEERRRELIEQELQVAALIQQTLLPRSLPEPDGWAIAAHYRPAREVGGDFYDFVALDDRRLGFVVGDVTDKGVPAALVMAATRSHLRAAAIRSTDPGSVLADVNGILVEEIPPGMFVTCLYGVLDTTTGEVTFANAGHNLPYVRGDDGVVEVRATGMPLGLMPGMAYEVQTTVIAPGAVMLLSSDGIVEAHAPDGEMYGFDRVRRAFAAADPVAAIDGLLSDFLAFVDSAAEQEDDITLVAMRRMLGPDAASAP